jgi:sodium transport system permease protein
MLRDRTTLFMMILLPIIIYPLISVTSAYMVIQSSDNMKRASTNIVINRDEADFTGALRAYFDKGKNKYDIKFAVMDTAEIHSAVAKKTLSVYIELPDNFGEKIKSGKSSEITLKYDLSNDKSGYARGEITRAINGFREKVVGRNLEALKVDKAMIYPFDINGVNIATPSQMGDSFLARILPLVIIMFATLGSFYPAIDVTAMEKERGTLETLLLAPASALDIMFAKFLAVFCLTMFSIVINLLSISLTITHGYFIIQKISASSRALDLINFSISPYSIIAIFVFMAPIACIMSALMMQVAIFARNFKEAQNYMTPILLVFMLPPMVSLLPGYSLNFSNSFIPVVNLTLLLKGMLVSNYQLSHAVITFTVNFILSILTLVAAAKIFASENILFRPSEDISVLYFWNYKTLKINQELSILNIFFIFQLMLLYYAGSFVQTFFEIKTGLLITEIFFIFLPSFIFIKLLFGDFLKTIEFKMTGFKVLAFSALAAMCCFGFTTMVTLFQSIVFSPPQQMLKELQGVITAASPLEFFAIAVIAALLPALCEEVMFRGMILNTLLKKYGAFVSAVICGLLFGVFHFSFYRFIPTAIIGFFLSLLKIRTGSIIPPMFAHFVNNFIIIAAVNAESIVFKSAKPSIIWILLIEGFILLSFLSFPFVINYMMKKSVPPAAQPEHSGGGENQAAAGGSEAV